MATVAPYGSWTSPITTDLLVEKVVGLADPFVVDGVTYFTEGRPEEAGRQVVVERLADGTVRDLLPAGYSARTRVHEYGGLCTAVHDGVVYFSNFVDQRLYAVRRGSDPEPITPEPPTPAAFRYAAPVVTPDGQAIICVRERHLDDGVVNDLVAVSTSGDEAVRVLASGHDFYGTPALSPDGSRVACCVWDHPNMPWDSTELLELTLLVDGPPASRHVAGGAGVSITQPRYGPGGELYFAADTTGWWNLYRDDPGSEPIALAPANVEFASPDWVFGLSSYAVLDSGAIVATWSADGRGRLGVLWSGSSGFVEITTEYTVFAGLRRTPDGVVALAAAAQLPVAVVSCSIDSGEIETVRASRVVAVDASYLAIPTPLEFPTAGGRRAHALVYRPTNPAFVAPDGELPPLIVAVHGGPTSAALSSLNYSIQYFTSRGFMLADVNYGGSSGYGREYRERLRGAWGVVDVEDCENVARTLSAAGEVDPSRIVIHGGSAGGWTTLCATTFGDVFAAGASYFGVANLVAFADETHKFESRYLDGLVAPFAGNAALYEQRSPTYHTDQMSVPLIIFQGLEDKVVPPNQSEMIVEALRSRKIPVAYLTYEGEQHGFRGAAAITRTAEAELYFYGRVLGFVPADAIEPVEIENAEALDPTG